MLDAGHDQLALSLGQHLLRERRRYGQEVAPTILYDSYKRVLTQVAKDAGVTGQVKVGCYRMAFITTDAVYKIQYNEHACSCILEEFEFIAKMRNGEFRRHFPQSVLVQAVTFPVLIQERINMNHRGIPETLHMQAKLLGRTLGLEDLHTGNYGWKGKRREEYPVFVDVDFHSNEARPMRSWFVNG